MNELIEQRTENSKTFDLGNGKRRTEICIGALHYKDDYKDEKEQFRDIDLTWVNNKITKAPYTLERIGNKINVLDKKTGKTSSIELDSIGEEKLIAEKSLTDSKTVEIVKDVDVEIIVAPNSIRYQTIIKDEKALKDLKYKIVGDIPISYSAVDADGDAVPLITSVSKDGILTESVDTKSFASFNEKKTAIKYPIKKTAIKYPIKIDPTLTIQGEGKDSWIHDGYPTTNYGSEDTMRTRDNHGLKFSMFVSIPLPSFLSKAKNITATFSIYYCGHSTADPNGRTLTITKLRRADWVESEVTHNVYKTGSNWGSAGAEDTTTDIDTSRTRSLTIPSSFGWVSNSVNTITNDAITAGEDFNVKIKMDYFYSLTTYNAQFYTKEYATDTSLRPKLVIDYDYIKRRKIFFI